MRGPFPVPRPRAALVLAAALALGGCLGGPAPTPRYYVLTPEPAGAPPPAGDEGGLRVRIGELRLPRYLERPQIVTRSAANRLELAEYHQWGGNLRENMLQVLARNLARRLETPHVSIPPASAGEPPQVVVGVTLGRFERGPEGRVRLSAWWRVSAGPRGRVLVARLTELAGAPLPEGADHAAVVAAMSALYGELAAEIAAAIRERVPAGG